MQIRNGLFFLISQNEIIFEQMNENILSIIIFRINDVENCIRLRYIDRMPSRTHTNERTMDVTQSEIELYVQWILMHASFAPQ